MKLSEKAKALAEDIELDEADAAVMELKSKLYQQAAKSIQKSRLTHEVIAKKMGFRGLELPEFRTWARTVFQLSS